MGDINEEKRYRRKGTGRNWVEKGGIGRERGWKVGRVNRVGGGGGG